MYYIGSDRNSGKSSSELATVCQVVQAGGKEVTNLGVNPSILCHIFLSGKLTSADTCVAMVSGLCLGTATDYGQKYYHQNGCTVVFCLCTWYGAINNGDAENEQLKRAHDDPFSPSSWNLNGTFSEYCQKYGHKYFYANSPEDAGQKILSGNYGGGTGSETQSNQGVSSPLLSGEMTFQELIAEIVNGIDLLFLCKRNNVVVTDFETIYSEAQYVRNHQPSIVESETLKLWQLEDGSYDFNVDQFGYYNTVYVEYDGGKIKESFQDLVQVFGEVPITYEEKDLDKESARMKARSYLAAHVREFNMKINATIIHDGGIDIGDIVTLDNPLTHRDKNKDSPEYLFVNGVSVSWDDGPITNDLELTYAPESPDRKEIPKTGTGSAVSGNLDAALAAVGPTLAGISFCNACQTHDCVAEKHCGDCWGMSDYIKVEMAKLGVTVKVVDYPTNWSEHHRSVLINRNGTWEDFPYKQYNTAWQFHATSASLTAQEYTGGTDVSSILGSGSTATASTASTGTTTNNNANVPTTNSNSTTSTAKNKSSNSGKK